MSAALVVSIRHNSSRSSPILLLMHGRRRRLADLFFLLAADRLLARLPSITVTFSGRVDSGCREQATSMAGVSKRHYREELEVRVGLLALLL
jgi:hypothetical protein